MAEKRSRSKSKSNKIKRSRSTRSTRSKRSKSKQRSRSRSRRSIKGGSYVGSIQGNFINRNGQQLFRNPTGGIA